MGASKQIIVTESISELRYLQKRHPLMISNRLRILIVLKQHEGEKLSKEKLSEYTGLNHNTVQKWRKKYELEGISALLVHKKGGGR